MRITLAALGTRGDVQPMIALGKGLRASGHDVTVIAGSNFASWVEEHGLRFVASVDIEALMASEKGVAWSQSSDNPIKEVRLMRDLMNASGQGMIDPIDAAVDSTDLFVSSFSAQPIVQTASEKSGVPYVKAMLQPQHATRRGEASLAPPFPRGDHLVNRWLGAVAERVMWWISAETTNRYRGELGLPRHDARRFVRANRAAWGILGFSRHVVPPAPDWPTETHLTGYWFLDGPNPDWSPPEALQTFLSAGPTPLYIGFGSMSNRDPRGTLEVIREAVKRSGTRAVVAGGWAGLRGEKSLPTEVFVVESAPHDWLLPRVAGAVHHGGAGTTAAVLRAGKPAMIVPHMSDQPYWGRRIHELGAGVRPVPRHKLTAKTLARGLEQLAQDARIRDGAAALGEKIRAERGVEEAVLTIERRLRREPAA